MINIENLRKQYGRGFELNIPGLQIPNGDCVGLVGNNGAGKTTFFQLILDLIHPTNGAVRIDGKSVQQSEEWKNYVGAYLDEHMLLSYLTADEYFELLKDLYGLSDEDLNIHLNIFSPLFQGEIIGNGKYIRELSSGNIKKVGIAAAMLGAKHTILLDEPFLSLDPTSQNRLKNLITTTNEQQQTTFLISSHDLTHVTDVCNRIILLEKGQIKQDMKAGKQEMQQALDSYFNEGI
jgi:ABC-2 type transport system ATP-binding protein